MGFSVLVDVGGDGFFFLNSSLISHKGKSGSVSFAKDRDCDSRIKLSEMSPTTLDLPPLKGAEAMQALLR